MKPYSAAFDSGTQVRIADLNVLKDFQRTWMYHNKLQDEQLAYAGRVAQVVNVGYYHGGDPLYWLEGIPGVWHEECLQAMGITS